MKERTLKKTAGLLGLLGGVAGVAFGYLAIFLDGPAAGLGARGRGWLLILSFIIMLMSIVRWGLAGVNDQPSHTAVGRNPHFHRCSWLCLHSGLLDRSRRTLPGRRRAFHY